VQNNPAPGISAGTECEQTLPSTQRFQASGDVIQGVKFENGVRADTNRQQGRLPDSVINHSPDLTITRKPLQNV